MERRHTISLMYTVYTPKWRLKPRQQLANVHLVHFPKTPAR